MALHTGRGRGIALLGMSLGYFMVLLDTTVLAVAEPALAASLHADVADLQWATTGYTVVFAALLLSAGAIADRYGADRVFRVAVGVFGLGSLLCALAPTIGVLIALRAVLGAAAAACVPASLALIAQLHPEPAARGRAIARWAAISGAAVAAGPVVGGALIGPAGWRAVFLVNVPIAVLVIIATVRPVHRSPRGERSVDWAAQAAAAAVLALLTDALIAAGTGGWPHAVASAAGAGLAAGLFVLLERRSTAPVLDPALLRAGGVRTGLAAGGAVNFALTGLLFVLPLLLRDRFALSPAVAGLAFLPLTLPFALNPPLTGRLVARFGSRPPVLLGLSLLSAGGGVLAAAAATGSGYGWLAVGLALAGFGTSFALPALVGAVVGAAPEGTAGAAGGVLNAARQTGATLGVAAMGACLAVPGPAGTAIAFGLAGTVCAAAALRFLPRPRTRRERRRGVCER
jgi:DHA2 family methylenomycin A resistance protein-like MFS transporter